MMKYRKTGKFKLGFLTLLLSVLFVACGSGASDADRQIKSKTDLKEKMKWSGDIADVMIDAKENSNAVSHLLSPLLMPISS